ncbi:metallophosphoesterase [Motilimonas eburnea]|uniref:metallophosphoesterase n=1 Tax=Motilimonas eburnea TaxID=1737488 RepID=UPI001E4571A8|nr:metallophosphoesterase [Motilimonas eburnea]MCE2572676.1 metallophosphoesterase [Motilimonas eburnea]
MKSLRYNMQFHHQHLDLTCFRHAYAIGDIHGKLTQLKAALAKVQFDPMQDCLISVGDLIDRGPESAATLHFYQQQPWFYAVAGNHELMMSNALGVWWQAERSDLEQRYINLWTVKNGGEWALTQTEPALKQLQAIIEAMPSALTCQLANGNTIGISHAQPHGLDWHEMQTWQGDMRENPRWIWGRTRIKETNPEPVKNVDLTIHGHTMSEQPVRIANSLFIDTASSQQYQGPFTLFELNTLRAYHF